MEEIWARVLKGLREGQNASLFALVNCIDDVEITQFNITLRVTTDAEYNMLNNNINALQKLAGGDYIVILRKTAKPKENPYLAKLQSLFGDLLVDFG